MYFSLNAQAVCNHILQIMDIVSRWPGATHDAYVFNNSRLRARLKTGEMGDGILLGDSGYPVRPYLLTPLRNPRTAAENLYNESQIRTRNCIERTFGVWKRRFPILSLGTRVKLETVQEIIVATAVLHKIAVSKRLLQFEEDEDNAPLGEEPDIGLRDEGQGNDYVRQQFINDYFRNL
ncbi:DDE superfamily endonuclease [Popillia japonica]|uniref:DDE superfamily endonuclease n=1 Tax=Popillia japonica TaxID=7064 RepID=A0AAW1LXD8_POPJA